MYLGNGPKDVTVLMLQARKSYALSLFMVDKNRSPLDITGCSFRLVVRKNVPAGTVDDTANLITNSFATLVQPVLGWARFELQASDLDFPAGDYGYSIVMSYQGYTTTIVKGDLQLQQNEEFASVNETYSIDQALSSALSVVLWEDQAIEVMTGPTLAPGQAVFTVADRTKLDELYGGAVAAGQTLTADDITDGVTHVMMTVAEREAIANFSTDWADITGKPAFGDIITHDADEFIPKLGVRADLDVTSGVLNNARVPKVVELRGISAGTAAPASGNPFTLYLKHP
jgi:hypothetical protein